MVAQAASGLEVTLRAMVTAIDWAGPGVRVESTAGTLTGNAVIVTVPTSILAAGSIRFDPPLPTPWRQAAENLPLGIVNKVFFALGPECAEIGESRCGCGHWKSPA